jgi:hypothetical protein
MVNEIMDLNAITKGESLVPFDIPPLRSSETYPNCARAFEDTQKHLQGKRGVRYRRMQGRTKMLFLTVMNYMLRKIVLIYPLT